MRSKRHVSNAEARKTAIIVAVISIAVAGLLLYRGRTTAAAVAAAAAITIGFFGLSVPPLARIFHRAWMQLAHKLGWLNSRIILTIVYFVVFVPYAMISRIFGRDPLNIRGGIRSSYWCKRERTTQTKEQFERLF